MIRNVARSIMAWKDIFGMINDNNLKVNSPVRSHFCSREPHRQKVSVKVNYHKGKNCRTQKASCRRGICKEVSSVRCWYYLSISDATKLSHQFIQWGFNEVNRRLFLWLITFSYLLKTRFFAKIMSWNQKTCRAYRREKLFSLIMKVKSRIRTCLTNELLERCLQILRHSRRK